MPKKLLKSGTEYINCSTTNMSPDDNTKTR